jgi:hypothetical protein
MYKIAGGILIKTAFPKMQRMPFDVGRGMGLSGRSASIRAMPQRAPAPPPPAPRPAAAAQGQTALAAPYQETMTQQPGSTGPIVSQPMAPPPGATTGPIAPRSADFSKIKGRRPQVLGSASTAGQAGKPTTQQTGAAGAGQGIMGTLGNWGNKALEFGRKDVSSLLPDSWTPGT